MQYKYNSLITLFIPKTSIKIDSKIEYKFYIPAPDSTNFSGRDSEDTCGLVCSTAVS